MNTTATETKPKRTPSAVPLRPDVHRALKLRSALAGRDMKEIADSILREGLEAELAQINHSATAA